MQAPRVMRRVNRAFTNPLVRTFAGSVPPLAIVSHRGRKSGKRYRTPVLAFETREGYVSPLPYGTDTDWCLNVVEAGECTLERLGRKVRVDNPRVVDGEAALPLLPAPLRAGLRLASLPGYLLVDRSKPRARRRGGSGRAARPSRS
jgi:deazaflavin-dependent oxidoreductase (nitroreductase family)